MQRPAYQTPPLPFHPSDSNDESDIAFDPKSQQPGTSNRSKRRTLIKNTYDASLDWNTSVFC